MKIVFYSAADCIKRLDGLQKVESSVVYIRRMDMYVRSAIQPSITIGHEPYDDPHSTFHFVDLSTLFSWGLIYTLSFYWPLFPTQETTLPHTFTYLIEIYLVMLWLSIFSFTVCYILL